MDFFNIDFSEVKSTGNFEPVPIGTYLVISDDAELKTTKNGEGNYISIKYKIIDGDQEGRFLFSNYNIINKNPEAQKIGQQQLKNFMDAAGLKQAKFKSPTEFVGYKAVAVVKHKTDSYGTKAIISYFKPLDAKAQTTTKTTTKGSDGLW